MGKKKHPNFKHWPDVITVIALYGREEDKLALVKRTQKLDSMLHWETPLFL